MGSNDIAPPHVYKHTVAIAGYFLQVGGGLWTLCYILIARESLRSKSYGMPLLALPGNLGWELVYSLYVVEQRLEKIVFMSWLIINGFIVYGTLKHGANEWRHSPWVRRNLALCLAAMTLWWCLLHWSFAKWWLESGISLKKGKWNRGVEGPDTTELGFWSASLPQVMLSLGSLAMLVNRQHTGGLTWAIWITRFLGSVLGFHVYYGWLWYMWREAHEYFMSSVGCVLWGTSIVADVVFAIVFARVKKTELVLPDGRRIAGEDLRSQERSDMHQSKVD